MSSSELSIIRCKRDSDQPKRSRNNGTMPSSVGSSLPFSISTRQHGFIARKDTLFILRSKEEKTQTSSKRKKYIGGLYSGTRTDLRIPYNVTFRTD